MEALCQWLNLFCQNRIDWVCNISVEYFLQKLQIQYTFQVESNGKLYFLGVLLMDMFIYSDSNAQISKKSKIRFFCIIFFPKIFGTWKLLKTCVTVLQWPLLDFSKNICYIIGWRWKSNNLWLWDLCRSYQLHC